MDSGPPGLSMVTPALGYKCRQESLFTFHTHQNSCDACGDSGFVQIPTLAVFALDHLAT